MIIQFGVIIERVFVLKSLEKYLSCVIVSVLIVLLSIVFATLTFTKSSVLSGKVFFEALSSKDVYSKVYNTLDSYYQEQYNTTGIPKEVYLDAIDLEEIETITNDVTYHGVNYICGNPNTFKVTYNFDKLETSINDFFEDYAKSIGYEKDDAYYAKVSEVTQNAIDKITSECDVFNWESLQSAGVLDTLAKYMPYVTYAQIGVGVAILVLLVILGYLNGRYFILDNVYWVGSSLAIASVIMLIPCIYLKTTDYFSSFSIKSETIFNSITGVLTATLDGYTSMWEVLLCVGVVLAVVASVVNLHKPKPIPVQVPQDVEDIDDDDKGEN